MSKKNAGERQFSLVLFYTGDRVCRGNMYRLNRFLNQQPGQGQFEVLVLYSEPMQVALAKEEFMALRFWRLPRSVEHGGVQLVNLAAAACRHEILVFIGPGVLAAMNDIFYAATAATRHQAAAAFLDIDRFFSLKPRPALAYAVDAFLCFPLKRAAWFLQQLLWHKHLARPTIMAFDRVRLRSAYKSLSFSDKKCLFKVESAGPEFFGSSLYLDLLGSRAELFPVSPGRGRSAIIPGPARSLPGKFRAVRQLIDLVKLSFNSELKLHSLNLFRFLLPVGQLAALLALAHVFFLPTMALTFSLIALVLLSPFLFYRLPWRKPVRLLIELVCRLGLLFLL